MVVSHQCEEDVHEGILARVDEPLEAPVRREMQRMTAEDAALEIATAKRPCETTPLMRKPHEIMVAIDAMADAAKELDVWRADQDVVRDETISFLKIAIPIAASILFENSAGIVQGMVLRNAVQDESTQILDASNLSDVTTSAVSLTVIIGIRYAMDTVCAQSVGAKQYTQLWLYAQAGLLAMAYCIPFLVIFIANASSIFVFLGQDPALASMASVFMRIGLLSLPFTMCLTGMSCVLTAQGIAVPIIVALLFSYAVTLPLGYWLSFHTSLGYLGIPISILINAIMQNVIIASVLVKSSVFVESWPGWKFSKAHAIITKLWPLGVSSIFMAFSQNIGVNVVSMLCGLLPSATTASSSNAMAFKWISLSYLPLLGFSVAGAVRVGRALGAGEPRRALVACRVTLVATLLASFARMILCGWFADSSIRAHRLDEETTETVIHLIYVMLPIIPLMACSLSAAAIFRACGQQLVSAKLNIATLLGLAIPIGYFLAFQLSWDLTGLWSGQILGLIAFAQVAKAWVLRQDWKEMAHTARLNTHISTSMNSDTSS